MPSTRTSPANIAVGLGIFDSLLEGMPLAECAEQLELSRSRCHQLSQLALQILTHPCSAWPVRIPDDYRPAEVRDRRKHREFWHARVEVALGRLRPCDAHYDPHCLECRVIPTEFLHLNSQERAKSEEDATPTTTQRARTIYAGCQSSNSPLRYRMRLGLPIPPELPPAAEQLPADSDVHQNQGAFVDFGSKEESHD